MDETSKSKKPTPHSKEETGRKDLKKRAAERVAKTENTANRTNKLKNRAREKVLAATLVTLSLGGSMSMGQTAVKTDTNIVQTYQTTTTNVSTLENVPIDTIFKIEFDTLGTTPKRQKEIRRKYDNYVSGLKNALLVKLDAEGKTNLLNEYKNGEKDKVAEVIRGYDEKELFTYLGEVFHKDFKASYGKNKLLVTSLQDDKFNCYSSSVILGDVLTQLGKPMHAIEVPSHIFLIGKDYAFETTSNFADEMTFPRSQLNIKSEFRDYTQSNEIDMSKIVYATYSWRQGILSDNNKPLETQLSAVEKGLTTDPKSLTLLLQKSYILQKMGKEKGALEVVDDALQMYNNTGLLETKANLLYNSGNKTEALETLEKAIDAAPQLIYLKREKILMLVDMGQEEEAKKLEQDIQDTTNPGQKFLREVNEEIKKNPKDVNLWMDKGSMLDSMRDYKGALEAFSKAIEIDPTSIYPKIAKAWALHALHNNSGSLYTITQAIKEEHNAYYKGELLIAKGKLLEDMDHKKEADKYRKEGEDLGAVWQNEPSN